MKLACRTALQVANGLLARHAILFLCTVRAASIFSIVGPINHPLDPLRKPIVGGASCGFPSPALKYYELPLSVGELTCLSEPSRWLLHADGDSLQGIDIYDGDVLVVDKALEPLMVTLCWWSLALISAARSTESGWANSLCCWLAIPSMQALRGERRTLNCGQNMFDVLVIGKL